ncbi:transposase [candidate division MSBL1 archaeon SCGC-AAA259I14]|uniref:Transposase n=2 Tax=candidate division MSBL1 TaxID=215777 RepID=A0A133UZV0_9EURY|nr:transposase [candidate division MSBL1 archaeon SCGC-AAA259I14]KXA99699.1 transposase [candidate division MSBL1 archaeon SCGC-AAA259O05]
MKDRKISFGVNIDENLVKELDKVVESSEYLHASRSEVVEAILTAYFRSDVNHEKKARELIIRRRKNKL